MDGRCKCLCVANHPTSTGICKGEATGELRFSNFPPGSPLSGIPYIDVEVCTPCKIATLTKRVEN